MQNHLFLSYVVVVEDVELLHLKSKKQKQCTCKRLERWNTSATSTGSTSPKPTKLNVGLCAKNPSGLVRINNSPPPKMNTNPQLNLSAEKRAELLTHLVAGLFATAAINRLP